MSSDSLVYLDASALVKLVVAAPETSALLRFLHRHEQLITCEVSRIEVLRSVQSITRDPASLLRAERVVNAVSLLRLRDEILDEAARTRPPSLGTLRALHLAAALSLGKDVACFVTYDEHLLAAADDAGLDTASPSG